MTFTNFLLAVMLTKIVLLYSGKFFRVEVISLLLIKKSDNSLVSLSYAIAP